MIFEWRRTRLVKQGLFGDALLLEYRRFLKKWKKRGLVEAENPSVREVESVIMARLDEGADSKIKISKDELSQLMDTLYLAGFSKKGIDENTYNTNRVLLKKV